jgi:error-prone DNA polymerase
MATPYVELHCHSGYSFLDGASHVDELLQRTSELGYGALALTDHDGLYGSMEFAQSAKLTGVQAITGAELTLRDAPDAPPQHVTLLAETPRGYANLCRLLSQAHLESPRLSPALPLARLLEPERVEGLILLTGCRRSPLLHAVESSSGDAEKLLSRLGESFGRDSVFVELQDNQLKGDGERSKRLARLADVCRFPVVATGNVHYHAPERYHLQDVLASIRGRTTLDGSHGVRRGNACFHLASPREMAWRFRTRPDALANTLKIARRCRGFDLTQDLGYTFPDFEGSGRGDALHILEEICRAEIARRYEPGSRDAREAENRLAQELRLVDMHHLAGFFLVYRDIMELARQVANDVRGLSPRAFANLPPGRGRGSSVSSIICYLIGLSNVDPVKANLFLGRFLNEAMGSVPDIDLDFSRDIREELILRVYDKYGRNNVGLVCTFPTYRLRSAVREIGKALDLPQGDLEKLAKLGEHYSAKGLKEELEEAPEFRERSKAPLWQALGDLADEIAGLPRHISQHVGGMVISSRPLVELVPLEPAAMEGRVLCQWDKDSCEDAGFIKIDFLALGMLSLVEEAVDLIATRVGEPPDLSRIDFQDEAVYDRICDGDTIGLFQVESRAQIQMLRRVRPRTIEDLAVQVAIVRPGPIVGGAVNPYVRRREQLREDPTFRIPHDHPLLAEPLAETLGVIIYQDQVLQVCKALAGFSDGQADRLRRAMSRKRSREAITTHWEAFRKGAAKNGVDEATAEKVFAQVVAFSEFGFPKSHAAAFALLAYQSAWLRHYHATEYNVALFNNQPMGFYALDALARDARRNGIEVLLPHVNKSDVQCTCEGKDLRVGLGFVRGWGADIAKRVVEERARRGEYTSLSDLLRRTPAALKRPAVENLIWVGGMAGFGLTRRELLWQAGLWLGPEAQEESRERGGRDDHPQVELGLEDPYGGISFPEIEVTDQLLAEYRMLHFSAAIHPLVLLGDSLPADRTTSDRFKELPQRASVRVVGVVVARQRPQTAKGYVFILMEDEAGPINVIVKPDIYERDKAAVRMEPFLSVSGRLQKDGGTMNVIATQVEALRADHAGTPRGDAFGEGEEGPLDPFRYLTALRQAPPEVKSFG